MRLIGLLLTLATIVCIGSGCGGKKVEEPPPDADGYAKAMRRMVLSFVAEAKKKPDMAAPKGQSLLTSMKGHQKHDLGAHKGVYEQLTTKCTEVVDEGKKSPKGSPALTKGLTEMADLAQKLPAPDPAPEK